MIAPGTRELIPRKASAQMWQTLKDIHIQNGIRNRDNLSNYAMFFYKGICIGMNGEASVRGRVDPNSTVGDRFLRKKTHKN